MIKYSAPNIRMWSLLGACGAYGIAATELPQLDDNMVACTADLCFYSGLERFQRKFPDRLYNVGIAEQNLVGIAGGLAKEGFNVFASTYASFATTRALDQVRVNMGYMQLPIKLIGLTSGLSVGILGATHMSIEDVAIMRSIPNITIISPADTTEVVKTVTAMANYDKPTYIRLTGTMGTPVVYKEDYDFEIGKSIKLREGDDIAIVSCGSMVATSLAVAEKLQESGISAAVIDMHTIKPIDTDMIKRLSGYKMVFTIEEHSVIGGLGGAVAECMSTMKNMPVLSIIGINDYFSHAGSYEYLIKKYGLDEDSIYNRIVKEYKENK